MPGPPLFSGPPEPSTCRAISDVAPQRTESGAFDDNDIFPSVVSLPSTAAQPVCAALNWCNVRLRIHDFKVTFRRLICVSSKL
jgi:hypothetical protein